MLEAEVRPMTDSEFTFPRPQPARSFRRSFSALPGQVGRHLRCIMQEKYLASVMKLQCS